MGRKTWAAAIAGAVLTITGATTGYVLHSIPGQIREEVSKPQNLKLVQAEFNKRAFEQCSTEVVQNQILQWVSALEETFSGDDPLVQQIEARCQDIVTEWSEYQFLKGKFELKLTGQPESMFSNWRFELYTVSVIWHHNLRKHTIVTFQIGPDNKPINIQDGPGMATLTATLSEHVTEKITAEFKTVVEKAWEKAVADAVREGSRFVRFLGQELDARAPGIREDIERFSRGAIRALEEGGRQLGRRLSEWFR